MFNPEQGDLIFLDFNPQSGHEQAGRRPAIVLSNDEFSRRTRLVIVCPISNTDNKFPLHIPLDDRTKTTGVILTEHIKCLDVVSRNAQYIETVPKDILETALSYVNTFF